MKKPNKFLIMSITTLLIAVIITIIFSSYLFLLPKNKVTANDETTLTTSLKTTTEIPENTSKIETTTITTKNTINSPKTSNTIKTTTSASSTSKITSNIKTTPTTSTSTTKQTTTVTSSTTQNSVSKIDTKRKELQSKYNIKIYYKDEIDNYKLDNYSMTKIYDEDIIINALITIDKALGKYPLKFLNELRNYKPLTIYLVKQITNGVSGITYNKPSSVYISLCSEGYLLESVFHHEIMHYIDCVLANKLGSSYLQESMKEYNPTDFTYGNTNNEYVYYYSDTPYFLSSYAKTNYLEDRATIFADMMFRTLKKDYYTKGNPINEKAKLISNQLSNNFSSVSNNKIEHWNRHIAW